MVNLKKKPKSIFFKQSMEYESASSYQSGEDSENEETPIDIPSGSSDDTISKK